MLNRLKTVLKKIFTPSPRTPFYLGHVENRIYHREDCRFGMTIRRRRFLFTQLQAVEEGYKPCKECQPDRYPYTKGEWVPNVWEMHRDH